MVGILLTFLSTVLVVLGFLLEIHFLVQREAFSLTITHNEVHDLTASLLTKVCHEVQVEPGLQPISGEQFQQASLKTEDGACLDISMKGFEEADVQRPFWM